MHIARLVSTTAVAAAAGLVLAACSPRDDAAGTGGTSGTGTTTTTPSPAPTTPTPDTTATPSPAMPPASAASQ